VEDLHEAEAARGGQVGGEAREAGVVAVVGDAELAGPALAVVGDVGGAGLDHAEAGAAQQPRVLVVRERAVGVRLLVGHRREPAAVRGRDAAREGHRIGERGGGSVRHGRGETIPVQMGFTALRARWASR
jgi:hypothetical protein